MSKNKKIAIGVIVVLLIGIIGYIVSVLVEIKNYEGYVGEIYEYVADGVYERNEVIISNKDKLSKNMTNVAKNIENVDKLVNDDKIDMKINSRIAIANEIESNVTKIINEYKSNKTLQENKDISEIMKKVINLDVDSDGWQKMFNEGLYEEHTGYNKLFSDNIINRPIAKLYGLPRIDELKSK